MKKGVLVFLGIVLLSLFGLLYFFNARDTSQTLDGQIPKTVVSDREKRFAQYKNIMMTEDVWYLHPTLKPQIDKYFIEPEEGKPEAFIQEKRAFIQLVGTMLENGEVKLGEPLEDFDEAREPIDKVVIHHTDTAENIPPSYVHGIHLFTLYVVPIFMNPENSNYGKPVFSGHYNDKGNQVFYGYHYLVQPDGKYRQTLQDQYLGYHAKGANAASIGIAIIGSYNEKNPSQNVIQSIQEILQKYPQQEIYGHREVTPDTEYPGETFLGENGWKNQITTNR